MKDNEATCQSKERYESLSVASAVAEEYLTMHGVRNSIYLCTICKHYHLTHISRKKYGRVIKKNIENTRKNNFGYHSLKHKHIKR